MTTARDIISGAYCRLGLLPLGADLDPERAQAGLSAYNDMLDAWAADGSFPAARTRQPRRRTAFSSAAALPMASRAAPPAVFRLTAPATPRRRPARRRYRLA